jgi:hypothetical protein
MQKFTTCKFSSLPSLYPEATSRVTQSAATALIAPRQFGSDRSRTGHGAGGVNPAQMTLSRRPYKQTKPKRWTAGIICSILETAIATRGNGSHKIDVGKTAVTPGERHPVNLSLHQSPVSISQSQAEQPLTVATDTAYGAMILVCAMASAGFVFTLLVSYPGYLTADATYVYESVQSGFLGDWQSPLMTIVWGFIDPISPGSGSMFLLIATLYWAAFAILALAVARHSTGLAIAVPLLAFAPPAFMLLAMIWRDVFFGTVWLLAATIIYFVADRSRPLRWTTQGVALVLVGFGVLLRPNAIIAAPLLVAYVAWPERFEWKRTALLFMPALLAGYGLIQIVYYEIFAVHRENPLHSLVVFDLGGITHFTQENQFPVSWSADENALLITQCYDPARWDTYWTWDPCNFVMSRLQSKDDVIFGTSRLARSWLRAVAGHPVAYLTHRLTFLRTFLARSNLTIELENLALRDEIPLARNRRFVTLMALYDVLKRTVLFLPGIWLIFAATVGALAWRGRATPPGAFAISVAASGIIYILSFGVFGVAADLRYAYWCVLASLAGLIPALLARRKQRSKPLLSALPEGCRP